jgi:putative DNA primase/helicase
MTDDFDDYQPWTANKQDLEKSLQQLGGMSPAEYGQRRKELADEVGIPVSFLDREYNQRRKKGKTTNGTERPHWEVEPWLHQVDGTALIRQISDRLRHHVVMTEEAALTASLWIVLSWVHDAAVHSPILLVTSPEAECGKSTLMGLIGLLVPRGLIIVEISPAVLYRMIESWHPTLIVDEADHAFKNNPELRAVINAGWTRGTGVPRCHPETHEPEFFETFGPKCIGMKGLSVPDTTLSRSIIIEMQRKRADEPAQNFQHIDDDDLSQMRRQLSRWASDNIDAISYAVPRLPDGFTNRLAANWRLMLAIAEAAGGRLADQARAAAVSLSRRSEDASLGAELLFDIRRVFTERGVDRMRSEGLVASLVALDDRAWPEMPFTHKPITQSQLARLLKGFKIKPKTIRIGDVTAKGYKLEWFVDLFERYLIPDTPQ